MELLIQTQSVYTKVIKCAIKMAISFLFVVINSSTYYSPIILVNLKYVVAGGDFRIPAPVCLSLLVHVLQTVFYQVAESLHSTVS